MAYPNPNVSSGSTPGPASETPSTPIPILGTFNADGTLAQAYGAGGIPIALPVNPMTTAGDIIIGGTAGVEQRLAIGSTNQVLTVSGGVPVWAAGSVAGPPPVNAQTGTTYTLALTDAPASATNQGIVTMNNASANTLTIPANGTVAFPVGTGILVIQLGAGQTTIAITTDTLLNSNSVTARAQNSILVLTKIAATTWVLGGDNS
jgi:hypothetical protein